MSQINFDDLVLNQINTKQSYEGLLEIVIKHFCSKPCDISDFKELGDLLQEITKRISKDRITVSQFNELLLLLNQDKIGKGFFEYFFLPTSASESINLNELKKGVTKFRGFSLLKYGNFRFAFNRLIRMSKKEIERELEPYSKESKKLESKFKSRHAKMLGIRKILRDDTWYVGYITKQDLEKDISFSEIIKESLEKGETKYSFDLAEISEYRKRLYELTNKRTKVEEQALKNTTIYLTWDYLDVYIATSMRNKWEFQETWDFTKKVFDNSILRELNLCYFDPTQSKCNNPREKGLVEGLMLKKALCTVYLAQKNDTMGKDSELAATLAQGKPVIAYIPHIDINMQCEKIAKYPLNYLKNQLNILNDEDAIDQKTIEKLRKYEKNFEEIADTFLKDMDDYRTKQPFKFRVDKDEEFRKTITNLDKICMIIAITQHDYFENRATLLRERHPLSMQVNLHSGVANGVLVVRNAEDCAELLFRLLVNKTKFKIKHKKQGYTILEEEKSRSPFRVVIENERLTNAFWNSYFE